MDWREDRIESAVNGTNPMIIAELKASYVAIGDTQFLEGYCVLLPKEKYYSLNDMEIEERTQFLKEMSIVGDAIINVCSPLRINYDILGNTDAYLHAHVFPRYASESEERRKMPVWLYDKSHWTDDRYQYTDKKHKLLRQRLIAEIERLTNMVK
ncbi:HIT family protein [Lactococcus ileimucosae]|uniref:HIT family protein n=1 Tax=Lactococcus ileimucosae TaxID=2941329 RepID=UPI002043E4DD|nr:HIT domain-containing protein [Lactococcus ileimucosae]